MTVLMFGWEFPPHIAGGLGTLAVAALLAQVDPEHGYVGLHVMFLDLSDG